MGGEIHVASRRGAGSSFSFELNAPAVVPHAAVVPPERFIGGYKGARKTVLVVDDVAENRAVAVDLLSQLGFDTAVAGNGLEALEKVKSLRPALVLMDVVMPGMDGLEAIRRLRQMPEFRDLPVVAVSAGASGSDAAQSLAAGANAFLPKPIDFNRLLSKVAALLNIEWSDEVRQAEVAGPSEAAASVADPSIETLIAPPPEEIEALHHLARLGDMKAIAKHATHLPELDERYRAFADHVYRLAKDYRSKAILSFVERYLIER
jgi:CheY-like chemotaxis protein